MEHPDVLPALLRTGLKVIFCGTSAGTVSARRGAYYAGPGNRFWEILAETGMTPRRLCPEEFHLLPSFGIGLTDLAKFASGADSDLSPQAFDRARLESAIRIAQPRWLAFNGKKAAEAFLDRPTSSLCYKRYEAATPLSGFPPIMVLPSTSRAASRFWDPLPWLELAQELTKIQIAGGCDAS